MKKYIIGALIGFVLSLGVSAHAEVVSMIGKVIDGSFPITIKGVTLQNPAITIAGVSYVPTREFAESLGATVKFDANLGIEVVPIATPSTIPAPQPTPTKEQKIQQIQGRMEVLKMRIIADNGGIEMNKDTPNLPIVTTWKETVAKNEKELSDLQSQLAALQSQP